jgi:hypothetical protein
MGKGFPERSAPIGLLVSILRSLAPYVGWGVLSWTAIYMPSLFCIAGLNLIQHRVEAD